MSDEEESTESSEDEGGGGLFEEEELSDDGVEALKRERRSYRKGFKSRGVLSKEWIAVRDAMKRSDDAAFAKIHILLKNRQGTEVVKGTWGGSTLLHHAARYGRKNCVKKLLSLGALATKQDSKGLTPLRLARQHGHGKVALVIEFWESPTVNRDMDDAPNLEYDPVAAAEKGKLELMAATHEVERQAAAAEAALEASAAAGGRSEAELDLARDLGVTQVKTSPPRTSKQPPKAAPRESMGDLETDNKDALMSAYQKFHADGGGGGGGGGGDKNKKGQAADEPNFDDYDW